MTDYLGKTFDLESPDFISTYDELTLWAAPFKLMLLDRVRLVCILLRFGFDSLMAHPSCATISFN